MIGVIINIIIMIMRIIGVIKIINNMSIRFCMISSINIISVNNTINIISNVSIMNCIIAIIRTSIIIIILFFLL